VIKKILITAFFLVTAYSVYLETIYQDSIIVQHQWQDSIIKAQHFLYDDSSAPKNVIVGSSLSYRIILKKLPGTYDLSFNGMSIIDGLSILSTKKKLPDNVFIELNVALRPENKSFTSYLKSPLNYYVWNCLPALRDENQPLGFAGAFFRARFINGMFAENKACVESPNKHGSQDAVFQKMLSLHIAEYSRVPDSKLLTDSFNAIKQHVAALEGRGVNIIFFEMPVNEKLCDLVWAKAIRDNFYLYFPPSRYRYIAMPDCSDYKTTDGLHLSGDEALKYTNYFKAQAQKNVLFIDKSRFRDRQKTH
jgi:hypothetical protein